MNNHPANTGNTGTITTTNCDSNNDQNNDKGDNNNIDKNNNYNNRNDNRNKTIVDDPIILENHAYEIVERIQGLIDALRLEFPMQEIDLSKQQQKQHQQQQRQQQNEQKHPSTKLLYSRLEEIGYTNKLQSTLQKFQQYQSSDNQKEKEIDTRTNKVLCSNDSNHQRTLLLFEILLPLISALTNCYQQFDELLEKGETSSSSSSSATTTTNEQTEQQQSASFLYNNQNNNKKNNNETATIHKNKSKNKPPPPPRGMLSLQNYTDVACLLEFTICTGILPHLESGVLITLEDRIKYHLSKSLAGRIPRMSLYWASQQQKQQQQQQQQQQSSNISQSEDKQGDKKRELVQSATVISKLIFLDRFRPMLLPRHLADVYAAFFQAEQLCETEAKQEGSPAKESKLLSIYAFIGLTKSGTLSTLDPAIQAKAYQTLLLQGTKGPTWIRQRVSPLLTSLACTHLTAIVQVFVPISEPASASQRLGQALATSSKTNPKRLVPQILILLQAIFPSRGEISGRSMGIIHTIWAILRHWPSNIVKSEIFAIWESTLVKGSNPQTMQTKQAQNDMTIHATIRQIGGLVAFCPPSSGAVLQWFLPSHTKVFGALVRLASMPTKTVLVSTAKEDARQVLYWISRAMVAENGSKLDGPSILAVTWVNSFTSSPTWDLQGYQYCALGPSNHSTISSNDSNGHNSTVELERVEIHKSEDTDLPVETIVDGTTARVTTFVDILLKNINQNENTDNNDKNNSKDDNESRLAALPSKMFQLLLRIYLLSIIEQGFWSNYQIAAIVVLPLLCEQCSPESLLFADSQDATGLLDLIKLVLSCRASSQRDMSTDHTLSLIDQKTTAAVAKDCAMLQSLEFIQKSLKRNDSSFAVNADTPLLLGGDNLSEQEDESLLSLASIVLSLLIAVLELGSKMRSTEEESTLQSFLPILTTLAQISPTSNASQESEAGLADMSSYAMALIASRQAVQTKDDTSISSVPSAPLTPTDKIQTIIDQAEEDLQSTQPPIRARGMVSLGRLARAYVGIIPKEKVSPLIVDLDDDKTSEEASSTLLVQEVLRLSMIGLSDSESYVYLAAIQTIVAIGDMRPKEVIPVITTSISSGIYRANEENKTDESNSRDIQLSDEQRIKLAEALMFIIRRRAAIAEFIKEIINSIIFGSVGDRICDKKDNTKYDATNKNVKQIQDETRKYFLEIDEDLKQETKQRQWEEQDIRLKTGGPVFQMEEADVVRAARVSIVAELTCASKPSIVAPHCRLLIRLVIDILRLETSRAVCRAAAFLARELYGCLLREQDELAEIVNSSSPAAGQPKNEEAPMPLAVAMIMSDEDLLVSVLKKIIAHQDGRINDSATTSRCEEALLLRQQAEDEGIFAAGQLILSQKESNSIPNFLRSIRKNTGGIIEIDKQTLGF